MAKEKEELKLKGTNVEEKKTATRKKSTASKAEEKETKKTITAKKTTAKKDAKPATNKPASKGTKVASKTKKSTTVNPAKKETATKASTSSTKKDASITKKAVTKTTSSKTTNSSKKVKETNIKKDEKDIKVTPNKEKEISEVVKEETIIEKIKSFIAKIAAMQEEAKRESLESKEEKKTKKSTKKTDKTSEEKPVYLPEYYDLPYRYNETVVKILAQTPKRIFVYWDVADEDKIKYQNAFGNDFFEKTYPVLLVHNEDKGYTTEIPINDFANSWYIDINDPKTNYTIQLGRKFKEIPKNIDVLKIQENNIILKTDYLPIAQSNRLEVPNNRILFTSLPRVIKFRNVKTYEEREELVSEIKTTYGNMYNIREFYKENYKEEIDEEIVDLNNPTSGGLSSSSFK